MVRGFSSAPRLLLTNERLRSSFLPQDKVSSFAAMTPQQLLIETQKAAGDPNLSSWFETLKEEGKLLKVAAQVNSHVLEQIGRAHV